MKMFRKKKTKQIEAKVIDLPGFILSNYKRAAEQRRAIAQAELQKAQVSTS